MEQKRFHVISGKRGLLLSTNDQVVAEDYARLAARQSPSDPEVWVHDRTTEQEPQPA